jgi:hypothetical protein
VDQTARGYEREASTGDPEARARDYTARVRRGLPIERVGVIAYMGDEGARLAAGWKRAVELEAQRPAPKEKPGPHDVPPPELWHTPAGVVEVGIRPQEWGRGLMRMMPVDKPYPVLWVVGRALLPVVQLLATSKAPSPIKADDARYAKGYAAFEAWLKAPQDEAAINAARDAGLAFDDVGGYPGVFAEALLHVRCNLPRCFERAPTQHFENALDLGARVYAHDVKKDPAVLAVKTTVREALTPVFLDPALDLALTIRTVPVEAVAKK